MRRTAMWLPHFERKSVHSRLTLAFRSVSLPDADLKRQLYVRVRLTALLRPQTPASLSLRVGRRFVRAAAFAAAIVVPAIASAQDLGCDLGDLEVRSLEFRGNRALSDDELALRVITTPSALLRRSLRIGLGMKRCLNRLYLPRDLASLELYYRERGYFDVKIDTTVRPMGKNAVGVAFTIVEGQPTILRSYSIIGLSGIRDSATIVSNLRLRTGQPYDIGLYFADMDSITRRLRNAGYYRASTIQARARDADSLTARAVVQVVAGKRAKFGPSRIQVTPVGGRGQQVPDEVVRRVMGIAPGTVYSDRAITESQRSLFQLGVYRHVQVEPLPDTLQPPGDTIVILGVSLTEDYMKRLDSEYGWATLDCGRIRAQYADLNFLHSARRFEVTGQASKIGYGEPLAGTRSRGVCTLGGSQSALAQDSAFSSLLHYFGGVSVRQPRLLGTRWVPTLSLYRERRGEFKAYLRTTKFGSDLSATRDIGDRSTLRVGFSEEYGQTVAPDAVLCALFSRCDEASRLKITSRAKLGVASANVARVHTDNLVSPSRGTIMRAELRSSATSGFFTDSALYFNKASADVAWYTPFGWRNTLSLRVRAGGVMGRRLNDTLAFIPPQERLYAGGATSIRGFQQNELGEVVYIARAADVNRDTAGTPKRYSVPDTALFDRVVPIGGNTLFVANIEYRVRDAFLLPNLLQYAFFLDAGDVWTRPASPSIKWTPGFGLRALTPIGPIQVNVGYNQYARPSGPVYFEDPTRLTGVRPDISPLYCVSPGNTIDLQDIGGAGVLQPLPGQGCPGTYTPRQRSKWYQRLVWTIQIGPDF